MRVRSALSWVAVLVIGFATGCGNFFSDPNTTTTSTTTTTGDYAYAVNTTTNSLYGYSIGSGALTAISGSPVALQSGLAARSVVVTPGNGFVYVGGNGGIYGYAIGTGGVLTAVTAGDVQATANFVSLTASLDGKWLLGLDSGALSPTPNLYVYGVNTSTGALSLIAATQIVAPNTAVTPAANFVTIAENDGVVAVTLGQGGAVVYPFNDTTGAIGLPTNVFNAAVSYSYNGAAFDATSSFVFFSQTALSGTGSGVVAYPVTGLGILSNPLSLVATGNAPTPVLLDSTGTYVYVGNRTDGTVSAYKDVSGALTPLAPATFASSPSIAALTRDNSSKYLVGVGSGGGNDVTLYELDALMAGNLDAIAVAATGSTNTIAVAATHNSTGN